MKKKKIEDGGFWSFCLINGRLAEFSFEIKNGKSYLTYGHCYVKRSEYKTKYEQKMIDKDIKKHRFTFRNGKYRRVGESAPLPAKHFRIPKKTRELKFLKTTKTSETCPRKVRLV